MDNLLGGLSEAFGDIPSNLTKERQLRELKRTGAVQDFTAKFVTLVRQFQGWGDHPMIFTYFERLKPELRQEILKVQTPPKTFSEYVTFVKNIENALAAARLDKPFRSTYVPPQARAADQIPTQQIPPHLQVVAMDIDGTRRQVLKLQPRESARRKEGNLCHYCGLAG